MDILQNTCGAEKVKAACINLDSYIGNWPEHVVAKEHMVQPPSWPGLVSIVPIYRTSNLPLLLLGKISQSGLGVGDFWCSGLLRFIFRDFHLRLAH